MEQLINRIVEKVGLEPALAQQAVGMILGFLQKEGPTEQINALMAAIPGASELISAQGGESGGGMMSGLMGMMGGGGGVMALGSQLMSAGLGMGEIQGLSKEVFAFAREKIGEDEMGAVVGAIPGLSQFV
jgi:hypothetical protein